MLQRVNYVKTREEITVDVIEWEELDKIVGLTHWSTYAAIANNGYLDVYDCRENRTRYFDKIHAQALTKCDSGGLMGYKGYEGMMVNHDIFEEEVERLKAEKK